MKLDILLMSMVAGLFVIFLSWQIGDTFNYSKVMGLIFTIGTTIIFGGFIYSYIKMWNERKQPTRNNLQDINSNR